MDSGFDIPDRERKTQNRIIKQKKKWQGEEKMKTIRGNRQDACSRRI